VPRPGRGCGNDTRSHGARVRTFLHHEAARQGHGARRISRPSLRTAAGRPVEFRLQARQGLYRGPRTANYRRCPNLERASTKTPWSLSSMTMTFFAIDYAGL